MKKIYSKCVVRAALVACSMLTFSASAMYQQYRPYQGQYPQVNQAGDVTKNVGRYLTLGLVGAAYVASGFRGNALGDFVHQNPNMTLILANTVAMAAATIFAKPSSGVGQAQSTFQQKAVDFASVIGKKALEVYLMSKVFEHFGQRFIPENGAQQVNEQGYNQSLGFFLCRHLLQGMGGGFGGDHLYGY